MKPSIFHVFVFVLAVTLMILDRSDVIAWFTAGWAGAFTFIWLTNGKITHGK